MVLSGTKDLTTSNSSCDDILSTLVCHLLFFCFLYKLRGSFHWSLFSSPNQQSCIMFGDYKCLSDSYLDIIKHKALHVHLC